MSQFKPGDLVQLVRIHDYDSIMIGIIIEKVHEPMAQNNEVFKILWRNGTTGNYVWDYDLEPLNEAR